MSYKLEDIAKMIDAGFTADEIRALDTDGLFTYAGAAVKSEPAPAGSLEPKAVNDTDDSSSIKNLEETINKGFQSIINAFQVSAVGGSQQKILEAKTSEDILAEIISPYSKEGGSK